MIFTHPMRAIFSLFCWTCVTRCVALGGTQSKLLTTLKPFYILLVLGNPCYGTETITFLNFIAFFGSSVLKLSFIEGDALQYTISSNLYQNPPLFLDLASGFTNFMPLRFTMGQWSTRLIEGPRCSTLATSAIVMRIPFDNFDLF